MRLTLCAASLLIANLYALQREPSPPQLDDPELLAPIQIDNLTLIPIVGSGSGADDMLTFDEAMSDHRLRVRELPGDRVDALEFANAADQPVLVLAGELVLGGKQDRIVAATTLIPPHSTHAVPVRCVEHGRWNGSTDFISGGRLAHDRLRGNAAYADQADVWAEVERANQVHYTTNPTDTYRNLAELQPAMTSRGKQQIDAALAELPETDRSRMVGYVVAYNGEIASVDRFHSPALFRKLERKLLESYLAEAFERRDDNTSNDRAPCIHAIRDFIANASRGEVARVHATPTGQTVIQRGSQTSSSHVETGRVRLYSNYLGNQQISVE